MNFLITLYTLLLRAFPSDFRREYRQEMRMLFADMLQEGAAKSGVWGLVTVSLSAFSDLIQSSIRERLGATSSSDKSATAFAWVSIIGLFWVNRDATEIQPPLLVLIVSSFLLGAFQVGRAWPRVLLISISLPALHLIRMVTYMEPYDRRMVGMAMMIPMSLIFLGLGMVARHITTMIEAQQIVLGASRWGRSVTVLIPLVAGVAIGLCDFTLVSPVFALVGVVSCGIVLGSFLSKPIVAAAALGFGIPLATVFMMAMHQRPIRHHFVIIDACSIVWCLGTALVCRQVRWKASSPSYVDEQI